MDAWIAEAADRIAARARRELEALVAVSSPSGDVHGAEEAIAVAVALAPDEAGVQRIPCSTAGHADDLVLRVPGTGSGRLLLLGHLDTVIAHAEHRALQRDPERPERLVGSGSVDMKGGVVLALGVLRELAQDREEFAEVALLLVCDEEWRAGDFAHVERFAGFDACLCFEAGQLAAGDEDAVVVHRKAAGTLRVRAYGRAAHAGSAPETGANALLALAEAARTVAAHNDPQGDVRLTCVPTVMSSGDAFNVIPANGELVCDLRADDLDAFQHVLEAVPESVDGVTLACDLVRQWPGMDARSHTTALLDAAGTRLGRPILGAGRGGASDASHFASAIALTIDGLGPCGGGAHAPQEYVLEPSVRSRAQVALAVAAAVLGV